jgi:SAM-dependent methyltransferase
MVDQHHSIASSASDDDASQHWLMFEQRYDAAVAGQERRLQEAAAIASGDRVLDVGCGCGESTRNAARSASAGWASGIDIVSQMVERARLRASELCLVNISFNVGDAAEYPFADASFNVIISRHGATFFADPVAAFARLRRALEPGGRLVLVAWAPADRNEWLQVIGNALAAGKRLPAPAREAAGPFGFAHPGRAREVLVAAGLREIDIIAVNEPMLLGADAGDAFTFVRGLGFVRGLLAGRDGTEVAAAEARLAAALEASASATGVELASAAWLINARRI